MISLWKSSRDIVQRIYIPKYYDPSIRRDLSTMEKSHALCRVEDLIRDGQLKVSTGDEIGKLAYGTGDIPFVRTSDISNWEIKGVPKQGVSEEIYSMYASRQDIQEGDLLVVRDGTYLIGTNCLVTKLDNKFVYQSHILKLRSNKAREMNPHLLFLALNCEIVQRQLRSVQFTADTIDTIGNRYREVILPFPREKSIRNVLTLKTQRSLGKRVIGKAFIREAPRLIEDALRTGTATGLSAFLQAGIEKIVERVTQDTITSEFGDFNSFWLRKDKITKRIFLPKYYDPTIGEELNALAEHCECASIGDLVKRGWLEISTGHEIGKLVYGTGNIPFLRTSDFADWEIKHDPKQGVSEETYNMYAERQDMQAGDILLVRDGTYLVGTSCIVTEEDEKSLFCGGLYRLRSTEREELSPFLLLGLINSYIVKRQMRTKQFTRDVIDTLGTRLHEVVLPIPRSKRLRRDISEIIRRVVRERMRNREQIQKLAARLTSVEA